MSDISDKWLNTLILVVVGSCLLFLVLCTSNGWNALAICTRAGLDDTDCDMLPDRWETTGYDVNNDGTIDLNLAAMGALPNQKDIFVEIDYSGYHKPWSQVTTDLYNKFLTAPVWNPPGGSGIKLHFLVDQDISIGPTPTLGPEACLAGWPAFNTFKNARLGTATEQSSTNYPYIWQARKNATHYLLSVDTWCPDPPSSGTSEFPGNDLVMSLGYPGWGTDPAGHVVGSVEEQKGTIMHELGHNLNLRHGGNVDKNCKPNYLSVMSYTLQMPTFVGGRQVDYSESTLNALSESALSEPTGLNRSTPPGLVSAYGPPPVWNTPPLSATPTAVDWNKDGDKTDNPVSVNIDNLGISDCNDSTLEWLYGYFDWYWLSYWGTMVNYQNGTGSYYGNEKPADNMAVEAKDTIHKIKNSPSLKNVVSESIGMSGNTTNDSIVAQPGIDSSKVNGNLQNNTIPCDHQDPECKFIPCKPGSLGCPWTPCDISDKACTQIPSNETGKPHSDFTVNDLLKTRIINIEGIVNAINNIPDNNFTDPDPANVSLAKHNLNESLISGVNSVMSFALSNNYDDAINKLNNISSEITGAGTVNKPLIKDKNAQDFIKGLIDNFITALKNQK